MGFFSRMFKPRDPHSVDSDSLGAEEGNASELVLDAEYASTLLLEIDIDSAIAAHEALKGQLLLLLDGVPMAHLQASRLCLDNQCTLGRWLHGAGREALGRYPAFDMLVARHQYFHAQAAAVVEQVGAGQLDQARHTLNRSYRQGSTQVVLLLKELKRGLGR